MSTGVMGSGGRGGGGIIRVGDILGGCLLRGRLHSSRHTFTVLKAQQGDAA